MDWPRLLAYIVDQEPTITQRVSHRGEPHSQSPNPGLLQLTDAERATLGGTSHLGYRSHQDRQQSAFFFGAPASHRVAV